MPDVVIVYIILLHPITNKNGILVTFPADDKFGFSIDPTRGRLSDPLIAMAD